MPAMRRLAWDGMEFDVPVNWELARYHYPNRRQGLIDIEDEASLRMEMTWIASASQARVNRYMALTTETTERLTARADRYAAIPDLPADWRATQFEFREILPTRRQDRRLGIVGHDLVSAVYAPSGQPLRCMLRLHFLPGDPENPPELTRQIARSFAYANGHTIHWRVFDLDFKLDNAFELEATTFDIGAKLMVFQRAGRRLYCWTLSCADHIFKSVDNETRWVIGFLNGQRRIPGIVFLPTASDAIGWRRRQLLNLFSGARIARRCSRYAIGYHRDRTSNQLRIWVFNYRHAEELAWISRYPTQTAAT